MGNCETILGYIIFVINVMFCLTSAVIIAVAAYILIKMEEYMEFNDNVQVSLAIVMMVLGAIIMIIAFLGFYGASTENVCMMYTYSTLLALVLLTLIGVIVTMVVFKDDIEMIVKDKWVDAMDNYNNDKWVDAMDNYNNSNAGDIEE